MDISKIKIESVEMDECESMIIVTSCDTNRHEWIMQTTEARYDRSLGCLEFVNGEEFDPDELSKLENAHYEAANNCFNENVDRLYKAIVVDSADEYFYAETTSDIVGRELSRFSTEEELNSYVDEVNNAENEYTAKIMSTKDALNNHKDQFHYWNS